MCKNLDPTIIVDVGCGEPTQNTMAVLKKVDGAGKVEKCTYLSGSAEGGSMKKVQDVEASSAEGDHYKGLIV